MLKMKKSHLNDLETAYIMLSFAEMITKRQIINKPIRVFEILNCLIWNKKSPIKIESGKENIIKIDVPLVPPANKINKEKNKFHNKILRAFCFFTVFPNPITIELINEIIKITVK